MGQGRQVTGSTSVTTREGTPSDRPPVFPRYSDRTRVFPCYSGQHTKDKEYRTEPPLQKQPQLRLDDTNPLGLYVTKFVLPSNKD